MSNDSNYSEIYVQLGAVLLLSTLMAISVFAETSDDQTEPVIEEIISNIETNTALIKQGENSLAETPEISVDLVLDLAKQVSSLQFALDTNADGELDATEVADSKRAILKLDLDSNGIITTAELGGMQAMPELLRVSSIQQVLDVNGDNELSTQEVVEAEQRIKALDKNADWRIDVNELASTITLDNLASWLWLVNSQKLDGDDLSGSSSISDYLLVHLADRGLGLALGTSTLLVNADGEVQHQWPHRTPAASSSRAELLPNGLLLRSSAINERQPYTLANDQHGLIELVDWNGNVVWEYQRCNADNYCLYGPVQALPNGNILVTSFENDSAIISSSADTSEILTAGIYELKPNYQDGTTELVWSWGGNIIDNQIPAGLAALSYNSEQNQIVFTTGDHQQAVIIERGSSDSTNALQIIDANDLTLEDELDTQFEIIDTQWLQDTSGQADIALLVKVSEQYSILELQLPINKNGTYMAGVKPQRVKLLQLLSNVKSRLELQRLMPLREGGFLVLEKQSNQIVHVNQSGQQSLLPIDMKAQIVSAHEYRRDYAAFNDKDINPVTSVATADLKPEPQSEQSSASLETDPLTGIWSMMIDTPMGRESLELRLVQQGDLIAGDLDGDPLMVEVIDNVIKMKLERSSPAGVVTITYSGIIDDADMSGEYNFNSGPTTGASMTWSATR